MENSFFFRLTPWHNDPVCDPLGDVLFLQEQDGDELGAPWTPTPGPGDDARGEYVVRHAPGRTTFTHEHDEIVSELTLGVPVDDPVKITGLRLTNRSARVRRVRLTSYVEWTLGEQRERTRDWPEFRIEYRYLDTTYEITVRNPDGVCSGVSRVEVDERHAASGTIDLVDDAQPHRVVVTMGSC